MYFSFPTQEPVNLTTNYEGAATLMLISDWYYFGWMRDRRRNYQGLRKDCGVDWVWNIDFTRALDIFSYDW